MAFLKTGSDLKECGRNTSGNHEQLLFEERPQISGVSKPFLGEEHHSGRLDDSLSAKMLSTRPTKSRLSSFWKSHESNTRYFGEFVAVDDLWQLTQLAKVEQELKNCEQSVRGWRSLWRKTFDPNTEERHETLENEARKICGQQSPQAQDATPGQGMPGCQYVKILAILALIGQHDRIRSFFDLFSDTDLPINLSNGLSSELPPPFNQWPPRTVKKFAKLQWSVLSPQFFSDPDNKTPHHIFDPSAIPPFTSWITRRDNGSSRVAEVEIHPHHHKFTDDNEVPVQLFAVKQLLGSERRVDFEREVAMLKRMRKPQHKHLIQLLATYEQNQEYCLIFPWADADLHQYWKSVKRDPAEKDRKTTLLWLAEQCEGLAEGLSYIHRHLTYSGTSLLYHSATLAPESLERRTQPQNRSKKLQLFGRHGDIKPQNILWSGNRHTGEGTLKITDFGVTEFSRQPLVRTRVSLAVSRTYAPPESQLDLETAHMGPSYDIWSLGCVYLEFLAWWFGGWSLVETFASNRLARSPDATYRQFTFDAYYEIQDQKKAVVKTSVSEFIEDRKRDKRCHDFVRDFLSIIQTNMLVVEQGMSKGSKIGRMSSANIARELSSKRQSMHRE